MSEPSAKPVIDGALVGVPDPSEALAGRLAGWIADTDPEFYGLFGFSRPQLEASIAKVIRESRSDLAPLWLGGSTSDPAGLICAYAGQQMRLRQVLGLRLLLAGHPALEAVGSKIKAFARERAAINPDAFYLAKIYVRPAMRGRGWADTLMCGFFDEGRRADRPLGALHVRKDNAAAVGLYRRHGFVEADSQVNGRYLHLERRLG